MDTSYNRIAGRSLERLSALSDGLFAIAMTLLVIDLRVPAAAAVRTEHDLWHALVALSPRLVVYLMSFLTLGIFWVGHVTQLSLIARGDRNYAWIQIAFLSAIALMPFSTTLLAEFLTYRVALLVYWGNILLPGLALYGGWQYASGAGLVKTEAPADVGTAIRRRILIAQSLYAFGALLCAINTYWSIAFIVLVQLNYAIAPRIRLLSRV